MNVSPTTETEPLVSVIIPAFNSSEYIIESIDSALNQTHSAIEVIVVDDGSTDDTREKLQPYIESGQIHYHFQNNRGPAAARNAGVHLAKGKYLQFLDADDCLLPKKIERQVSQLEQTALPAASACDYRFFDGSDSSSLYGGDLLKGEFPLHEPARFFDFETVIHRWLFPVPLFRACEGFNEGAGVIGTEDWLLLWKLAANGTRFMYIDEPLVLYRRHGDTLTCDFERIASAHLDVIDCVGKHQKKTVHALYSRLELNALRESYHYELGLFYMRANRSRSAWYHLVKALFLSPNRRQVKLLLIASLPALGAGTIDWVTSANERLWGWRAQLRKTLVG